MVFRHIKEFRPLIFLQVIAHPKYRHERVFFLKPEMKRFIVEIR